jgi:hypothetical protein
MSRLTDSDVGAWNVSAALRGNGRRVFHDDRDFVFYVQRYRNFGRYTGEIATRTWDTEREAQEAADKANADSEHGMAPEFNFRGTYL